MNKFGRNMLMMPQPDEGGGASVVADPAQPVAAPSTETSPEQHGVTGVQDPAQPQGTSIDPSVVPSFTKPAEEPVQPGAEPVEPVADPVDSAVEEPVSPLLDPEAKPEDKLEADPNSEEEFEITLADDSPLSEAQFNELMDFVEANGLDKAQAESLIKNQAEMFTVGAEGVHNQLKAESEANRQKLLNDPEIGGDKWAESVKIMALPIKQFGDDAFNELINSDIGNHPALGKFLYRLGNAMKSDDFHGKGVNGGEAKKIDPIRERYPSFFEDEEKA